MPEKLPLFKNHHTHPSVFAALRHGLDLSATDTKADALAALAGQTQDFNLALGWNNSRYTFGPQDLDSLAPCLVCNVSFHEFLVNRPARERFGREYPEVVRNIDNTDWVERNLHQILKFIAGASALAAADIGEFFRGLAQEGCWFAEDKLLPGERVVRLYREAGCLHRTRLWADTDSFEAMAPESREEISGIKLFLDGAVGAGTAALNHPYPAGGTGLMLHTDQGLARALEKAADWEKPVSVHTIGNRSTAQLISVLEGLEKEKRPPEIRAEHCQFIGRDLGERAKDLGLVLSMQPNFSEDSLQYRDRLPKGYAEMNNPFRMLIDQAGFVPGQDLFFGTDGPPHSADYALKTGLFPPLGSQALTLEELRAGYCMPDFENGYVEAEIDPARKQVTTRTILAEPPAPRNSGAL